MRNHRKVTFKHHNPDLKALLLCSLIPKQDVRIPIPLQYKTSSFRVLGPASVRRIITGIRIKNRLVLKHKLY